MSRKTYTFPKRTGTIIAGKIYWDLRYDDRRVAEGIAEALNAVGERCVEEARKEGSHPNWKTRTGAARNSVKLQDRAFARRQWIRWGSKGIPYGAFLEYRHGPWMRRIANRWHPTLGVEIGKAFRKRGLTG